MFSFAGIIALLFFIFVRPQEIYPALQEVPLIYIFFGLAVFGLIVDLRLRLIRPQPTPQLLWVILFFGWAIFAAVLKSAAPGDNIFMVSILFVWFYLISHGLAGLKAFKGLYGTVLALSFFLASVGVHQNFADTGCVQIEGLVAGLPSSHGIPDGRACKEEKECYTNEAEPGKEYLCEKVGLFNTSSITLRVRYLGVFQDPSVLALTVAAALPFLIGMVTTRPSFRRIMLAIIGGTVIVLCIFFSKSRGGQLVLMSVLGVY
ncbi:MAG: hypothetical protein JRI55_18770, partial [Deltaproteobacteria bacterium]|nr:hypothetical protein [Deltaproteobacteria bacterium]